jgi:hypothetical protein
MGEVKNPTNQPHIIDVEDEDNPEELTDEITTMDKLKTIMRRRLTRPSPRASSRNQPIGLT